MDSSQLKVKTHWKVRKQNEVHLNHFKCTGDRFFNVKFCKDKGRVVDEGTFLIAAFAMMMMFYSSTGRKELICQLRGNVILVGGNVIQKREMVDKAVQSRTNMDLGSGDTSDYLFENRKNYDSFSEGLQYHSHVEPLFTNTHILESSTAFPQNPPTPSTLPSDHFESTSSENLDDSSTNDFSKSNDYFKGKENKSTEAKDSPLIEESKQPSFKANESNPTLPAHKECSKTSTLRLSDRQRSEPEDDIKKVDDIEQDGTIITHKVFHKTTVATDDSLSCEKMDKNGNKSDAEQNEVDNDCIVQCLYCAMQCCECIIF